MRQALPFARELTRMRNRDRRRVWAAPWRGGASVGRLDVARPSPPKSGGGGRETQVHAEAKARTDACARRKRVLVDAVVAPSFARDGTRGGRDSRPRRPAPAGRRGRPASWFTWYTSAARAGATGPHGRSIQVGSLSLPASASASSRLIGAAHEFLERDDVQRHELDWLNTW